MEKFLALSKEKQETIIEAGYACFAQMGYKKTSVADIASKAGISKAMVFHYFGSKKNMYAYLMRHAMEEIEQIFREDTISKDGDYFQRLVEENRCKCKLLQKHPAVIAFLLSLHDEEDEEVAEDKKQLKKDYFGKFLSQEEEKRIRPDDFIGFKEGVDPKLVFHLLSNYVENIARKAALGQISNMDAVWEEVNECITMLQFHLLKNPKDFCEE